MASPLQDPSHKESACPAGVARGNWRTRERRLLRSTCARGGSPCVQGASARAIRRFAGSAKLAKGGAGRRWRKGLGREGRRAHVRLWPKCDRAEPNRAGVRVAVGAGEQLQCNGEGKGQREGVRGKG